MISSHAHTARPVPWWRSIRGRLALLFIAFLVVSLIGLSLLAIHMVRSHCVKVAREENLKRADDIGRTVESYMESVILDLFSVSRIWTGEEDEVAGDLRVALEGLLQHGEHIRVLSVFDIRGNDLLRVSQAGSSFDRMRDRMQEDTIESVLGGNVFIGHVRSATQGLPEVDISIPLTSPDPDEVRGILTAVVSLQGMYRALESVNPGKGREFYVVDTNGFVIACFSGDREESALGIRGLVPFWVSAVHVRKVRQYLSGIGEDRLHAPIIYMNLRRHEVLGVLAVCPELKWRVIVEEELDAMFAPVMPVLHGIIMLAACIFIIASATSLLIIGYMVSPLVKLYRFTEGLARGGERISIRGTDEVGRIGQNINRLVKDLSRTDEHLRRTYKELESINQEFEESYDQLEDVTGQLEESREHLRREKGLTEKLIEAVDLLIVGLDPDGRVVLCNRSFEERLGYGRDEIRGRDWFALVYPDGEREGAADRFQRLVRGENPEVVHNRILARDRNPLDVEWHATLINDAHGLPEGVILVGEDVTLKLRMAEELRRKNLELAKKNEELENILSIVSHDLKSPLYILQDFAAILLQDSKDSLSEDGRYYLQRIKANAEHMEKLILDLLELSRLTRMRGEWQEYAVSDIVGRVVEDYRDTIKKRGIDVRVAEVLPICLCDPERIMQVFTNLLSNAIKFTRDAAHPLVEIGYRETPDEHEFFIRDNGIGIDKENYDKIFVIFQRLQDLKDVEGTGVGLTIVKRIVEDHGGRVWVRSEKGSGATFCFTIPKKNPFAEAEQRSDRVERHTAS